MPIFLEKLAIIGNFPYNISTQIFFKVLKHREKVVEICRDAAEGGC